MELISIYKCLCDMTRLRILNLLQRGPLCVCHLQEVLDEPQVKVSKHLAYLRQKGLLLCERRANWSFYRLPDRPNPLLVENLKCLQDMDHETEIFREDLRRLESCRLCESTIQPNKEARQ